MTCKGEETYHLSRQFDTYCRKVIIGECRRYNEQLRQRSMQQKQLKQCSEDAVCHVDRYPSDTMRFFVNGTLCVVENDELGEALTALTEELRSIVLLAYYEEMSDAGIARALHIPRSTVQHRRTSALRFLRQMMELPP